MAPGRRANPISDCAITAANAAFGGKWKMLIIYWLEESPRQFGELRQLLPPISQKVLTEQLRELVADEIITRKRTGRVPAPVLYSLTDHGRTLVPLVHSAREWGRGHIDRFASTRREAVTTADARV